MIGNIYGKETQKIRDYIQKENNRKRISKKIYYMGRNTNYIEKILNRKEIIWKKDTIEKR